MHQHLALGGLIQEIEEAAAEERVGASAEASLQPPVRMVWGPRYCIRVWHPAQLWGGSSAPGRSPPIPFAMNSRFLTKLTSALLESRGGAVVLCGLPTPAPQPRLQHFRRGKLGLAGCRHQGEWALFPQLPDPGQRCRPLG